MLSATASAFKRKEEAATNHIWTLPGLQSSLLALAEQVKIAAIYPAFG